MYDGQCRFPYQLSLQSASRPWEVENKQVFLGTVQQKCVALLLLINVSNLTTFNQVAMALL